jgi:hypothetical protein
MRLQQFLIAAGTSLPSCYLATVGGYTYRHRLMGELKKYAVEIGSSAMKYEVS